MSRCWRRSLYAVFAITALGTVNASLPAIAQTTPIGVWLTEARDGAIDIEPCGATLCGRLVWFTPPDAGDPDPPIDRHNPDPALRHRPLCGITMMGGFSSTGSAWTNGWIYDPDTGGTYHAELTMRSDGTLDVHGYIAVPLLGKSQIWIRAPANLGHC